MAPHNSGTVMALCVHRGSRGRSDKRSSESAKSILAARGIYFQRQVTSFSWSSFDCRLRSYCRKQRAGGAGLMNINELNSLACSWSGAARTGNRIKKTTLKLVFQNGQVVLVTYPANTSFLCAYYLPAARAGDTENTHLCPRVPRGLPETEMYTSW